MMKLLEIINGKKTAIGIIAKAVTMVISELNPDIAGLMKTIEGYIDLWILGGITHKIAKVAS